MEKGNVAGINYKDTLQGIGIFGGVQVFLILAGLVKNKVLAVLLGPEGVGIIGIYTNTLSFLTTATAFGIGFSAIRNIAAAHEAGDQHQVGETITIARRWIWYTGFLGLAVTASLAPALSRVAFGDNTHVLEFAALSVTLLLAAVSSGQSALLRGMRKLRQIAYSSLYGAVAGLLLSLPVLYFYRAGGIVPSIIITALTSLFFTWIFARQIPVVKSSLTNRQVLNRGLPMAKLGSTMTLGTLANYFCTYLIILFISNKGGLSEVGFFQTGWSLVVVYTNTALASISADYFPRLSAVNSDNSKIREIANQQGEILLLLLGPMVILMTILIPQLIVLLYSREFLSIDTYVSYLLFGTLLHASTIVIGYIFMAKGDSSRHLVNELGIKSMILPLTVAGYLVKGIEGAGMAFVITNLFSLVLIYFRARKFYNFRYESRFLRVFAFQVLACLGVLLFSGLDNIVLKYSLSALIGLGTIYYSFTELNRRINLVAIVRSRLFK
jgi:O-antigen/teichoic acid export membrane protein